MHFRANAIQQILVGSIALGGLILVAGLASAADEVLMTAAQGETSLQSASQTAPAEGQNLETGKDGGCSVLLDRRAVVELCDRTRLSFKKDKRRGNRIVNIESGSVRLVVEPRSDGERIEIHTPAAIATIMGTVVYVTVDPVTGATTISSSESEVNIRGLDEEECTPHGLPPVDGIPECAEGTTISALEQFTIAAGEKSVKRKISQQQVNDLGSCLLDFHDLALELDRLPLEAMAVERAAAVDVASVGNLPAVGLGNSPSAVGDSFDDIEVELDPTDTKKDPLPDPPLPDPDPCGGIPCEHGPF
jgi:hypothetical protein